MIEGFDIGLVKLATDIGLGLALVFFGMRIKKPSLAPQALGKLKALEVSIKSLLEEAEQASVGLTEDLLRRRKELETALQDVKDADKKLNKNIVDADEKSREVIQSLREAERTLKEAQSHLQYQAPQFQSPQPSRSQHRPLANSVQQTPQYEEEFVDEYETPAPRQQNRMTSQTRQPVQPRRSTIPQSRAQSRLAQQQYGFENEPPSFDQHSEAQGLESQVETQTISALQNVQQAAQRTSVSNNALHAEAIKAALQKRKTQAARPQREVQNPPARNYVEEAVEQMPEIDLEIAAQETTQDARLGVLGGVRRHTQVV